MARAKDLAQKAAERSAHEKPPGREGRKDKEKEEIGDDFNESQPTTPTPIAKTMQALHSAQDPTTTLDIDRSWTAFEADELK